MDSTVDADLRKGRLQPKLMKWSQLQRGGGADIYKGNELISDGWFTRSGVEITMGGKIIQGNAAQTYVSRLKTSRVSTFSGNPWGLGVETTMVTHGFEMNYSISIVDG